MDEKYSSVKNALSCLCGIPAHLLRLAEVSAAQIKVCVPEFCVATWQLPAVGSPLYTGVFSVLL